MQSEIDPDRACDRCRERRVKCDKRKPQCWRCEKAGKPCPGYVKKRKFVDEGAILRKKYEHQVEPPAQAKHESSSDTLDTRPASITDRDDGSRQADPKPDSRWNNASITGTDLGVNAHPAEPISKPSDDSIHLYADTNPEVYDPEWFDLDPDSYYSRSGNSCGSLSDIPEVVCELNRPDIDMLDGSRPSIGTSDTTLDDISQLWAGESQIYTSQILLDQQELEVAYLIRHFCDNVGTWMDLFDAERHFVHMVPIKALGNGLLRYAIAAVAAKQLGCTKSKTMLLPNRYQPPTSTELIDIKESADWFYSAATYYDKAIMHSRVYLQALSGSLDTSPHSPGSAVGLAKSDDLLLAVSIFSLYETLDNAASAWNQHLNGLKTILGVLNSSVAHPLTLNSGSRTIGRRASFWNFARADYQSAYINRTVTLLDTTDTSLWLDSGLQLQPNGALYPDPEALAEDSGELSHTNQLVARTMLWILLRTMNCVFRPQQNLDNRQKEPEQLSTLLDAWYAARPQSFQPCIRRRHQFSTKQAIDGLFYSIPLCAATTQLYHFARLLLLLNQPSSSGLLDSSDMSDEEIATMRTHAFKIIGIAVARPCQAVRVEMLIPLHLAGSCLNDEGLRHFVADLIREIQNDTGCKAGQSVNELSATCDRLPKPIPTDLL